MGMPAVPPRATELEREENPVGELGTIVVIAILVIYALMAVFDAVRDRLRRRSSGGE